MLLRSNCWRAGANTAGGKWLDRRARPGEEGNWSTGKGARHTWPWKSGDGGGNPSYFGNKKERKDV